jgi:Domain of unknown function (DU1801)
MRAIIDCISSQQARSHVLRITTTFWTFPSVEESLRTVSVSGKSGRLLDERLALAVRVQPGEMEKGDLVMSVHEQIDRYIGNQSPAKSEELRDLHRRILEISPDAKLWFLDGRNDDGKVVSNPNIGYGSETLSYATGDTRAFYKIGLSANTSGISVYVMGLKDKHYLSETYGSRLGKAKITGYCIRFKSVKDIDLGVLEEVVADAMGPGSAGASS